MKPAAPSPIREAHTIAEVIAEVDEALGALDTLATAGERMRRLASESWPVIENHRLVGMIDGADSDRRAARYGHDPAKIFVRDCMSAAVAFCFSDQDCKEARRMMTERHVRCLPVVDHDMTVLGMIRLEKVDEIIDASEEKPADTVMGQ